MPKTALVLLCLVLGVVGGLLGGVFTSGPGPATAPGGAEAAGPSDSPSREDLARRIALLEERLAATPAGPAAVAPSPSGPPAADAPAPAAAPADATVTARLERLEKAVGLIPEDLTKVSTEDLKAHFQKNSQNSRNNGALVGVLEELLRRNLPEEEARKLRAQLGYGYRALGQHAKEEALFREMVRTLPPDTEDGQNAVFQLAWSRSFQRDNKEGSVLMEQLADNASASDVLRSNGLFQAGRMAKEDGDLLRARALLERLVGPEASRVHETQRNMIDQAKKMLAEIDAR